METCGVTIDVWQGGMEREREKERESTGRGQRDSIIRGQGERPRGKQTLKRIPLAISHLGSKN